QGAAGRNVGKLLRGAAGARGAPLARRSAAAPWARRRTERRCAVPHVGEGQEPRPALACLTRNGGSSECGRGSATYIIGNRYNYLRGVRRRRMIHEIREALNRQLA